ncbi:MAG: hypothetical protein NTV54_01335 [Ignavibacteriales bacterium]|nr:hypothetical protein [Ignavibacteriales bacterium]
MFEQEIELLITSISRETIGDGKSVSLRRIFESKIPANVKAFFRAEVEWMLATERRSERRPLRFDYSQPEIQLLQEQIDALLINNFIFTRTDFDATLDKSIHFLFNYLCRPQWTLMSFLFETSTHSISAKTVQRKLRFCRDYKYFSDIIQRYISHHGLNELKFDAMRSLLPRIDQEVMKMHTAAQIADMTVPIFEFVDFARHGNSQSADISVPTRALVYFFDDKGMNVITGTLKRRKDVDQQLQTTQADLLTILSSVHKSDPAPAPYKPTPRFLETPKEFQSKAGMVFGDDEDHVHAGADFVPVEAAAPMSPLFNSDDEQDIIREVFHGDKELYSRTIAQVLSSGTWEDAALVIDGFFAENGIEPFTTEAVTFTNILQSAFAGQ